MMQFRSLFHECKYINFVRLACGEKLWHSTDMILHFNLYMKDEKKGTPYAGYPHVVSMWGNKMALYHGAKMTSNY